MFICSGTMSRITLIFVALGLPQPKGWPICDLRKLAELGCRTDHKSARELDSTERFLLLGPFWCGKPCELQQVLGQATLVSPQSYFQPCDEALRLQCGAVELSRRLVSHQEGRELLSERSRMCAECGLNGSRCFCSCTPGQGSEKW